MSVTEMDLKQQNEQLNEQIDNTIAIYAQQQQLPVRDSDLVNLYLDKAAKDYDVSRSKNDIENCVELLSIAYNATPMKSPNVRVQIANIHQKIISSQGNAERAMAKASRAATRINDDLSDVFNALNECSEDEKKDFVINDFSDIVEDIQTKATAIHDDLISVASSFDEISKDTLAAASASELVLGEEVSQREKAEKTIAEYKAKQARLEHLVEDLRASIKKYNDLATKMEAKADTAEERAFITGLVQIGAEALSSIAAVACMSLGGPTGMATRAASNTIRDVTSSDAETGEAKGGEDNPAKLKSELSEAEAEKKKMDKEVADLEEEVTEAKQKIEEAELADPEDDGEEAEEDSGKSETSKAELKQLKKDLEAKEEELKQAKEKLQEINDKLEKISKALDNISKAAGQMRQQERETAQSFRDLQMEFLNKAEKYEDEKRKQDAELVEVKVLLASQEKAHDSIELTVKTLIMSVKSLKLVKSILEEIAAFFKNFAAFLQEVSNDAKKQSDLINKAAAGSGFSLKLVMKGIDKFIVGQTAEWYATETLSNQYVDAFHGGWKMMNTLSGKYLDEDELKNYIVLASKRIEVIAKAREQVASTKISNIERYRRQLEQEEQDEQKAS